MDTNTLDGGFADPVMQSQTAFRAVMDGLANPGTVQDLALGLVPPSSLSPELAAIALTLCDHDTTLWLDRDLATDAVLGWLRFHTSAPITSERAQAQFALTRDPTMTLADFDQGTDLYPDRSTTVALAIQSVSGGQALSLTGPGIDGSITIAPHGLPADFLTQWAENGAQFPRGVDLLLVADGQLIGLPRTTRIKKA
ncbi:MAG: phnH [Devosia sp.]|uniref:phosphonate C-P lyase system protein PhnH n=1 Tax=Devosia sp. TaxID=1871048 RepID=UPI00262EB98D|nr:phosphonate C-P lyase system protein PhnH [Devosia sp.]MDB5529804.1 phnH [Devosia sp.]